MKQRFVCRGLFIPLLLLVGLFSSCVREHIIGERNEQEPTVTFSLKVPKVATPNPTRSLTTGEESGVSTIHVMVFEKDGGYKYTRVGTQSGPPTQSGENIQITFEVTLPKGHPFDLVFIANGLNAITQAGNILVEGATKDAVLSSLLESRVEGTKWTEADIPMWGYRYGIEIDENTSLTGVNGISMVRMLAKIEVVLSKEAAGLGGTNENFSIEELVLYNYNTKGTLVPNMTDWAADNIAKKPNVPTGVGVKVPTAEFLVYSKTDDLTGTYFTPSSVKNTIYTFESKNGTVSSGLENVCLVIGGIYKGGANKSYYRVDFVDRKNKDQLLDLLRNHRYNFVISAITGDGLPTHKEAYEAGPVNIEANVLQWNAGDMGEVVFNDQNFLAINPAEIEHDRNAVTGQKIILKTDYDGGKPELLISSSETDPGIALPDDWLTLSSTVAEEPIVVGGDPATKYTISYDATKNETGNIRKAYIYVKVGRLTNVIRVTQSLLPSLKLSVDNVTNVGFPIADISELVFPSGLWATDPLVAKSITVNWAPYTNSNPCSSIATAISGSGFQWGDGTPMPNGSQPLISATGVQSYDDIKPNAFTAAQVAGTNAFLEETTLYNYTVSNGINNLAKTLLVRQVHYNAVADISDHYPMNATEHKFNVRSNSGWKIELKRADDSSGDPKGVVNSFTPIAGGYDAITGSEVKFKLVDKIGSGATDVPQADVYFTITCTDVDRKFDPIEVEINALGGIVRELSNTYIVAPNSTPILIPVKRANGYITPTKQQTDWATHIGVGNVTPIANYPATTNYTAELVWTDTPHGTAAGQALGVDGALKLLSPAGKNSDGFIFVMPGSKEGNSVVAVKVGANIVWSWHIWVTNGVKADGFATNNINAGQDWMDRNLGAMSGTATDGTKTYGVQYQWGRKDPFPGNKTQYPGDLSGPTDNSRERILYNQNGEIVGTNESNNYHGSVTSNNTTAASLQNSLQNPLTFYIGAAWYYDTSTLWGVTGTPPSTHVSPGFYGIWSGKTIYDPCPEGWRVPNRLNQAHLVAGKYWGNEEVYVGTAWWDGTNHGLNWNGTYKGGWYPAAGSRSHLGLNIAGTHGHNWAATPYSTSQGFYLRTNSSGGHPSYGASRHHAFSVRCVKE